MKDVKTTRGPLATQRLLLAGLVVTVGLSAALLVLLRSGSERGRGSHPDQEGSVARAAGELALTPTVPARRPGNDESPTPTRAALEATPTDALGAEAAPTHEFDPGALFGRVQCAGRGLGEVELRVFPGALERRERRTPLAQATSDSEGRFRIPGLQPHARYVVHAQHPDFLPMDATLFPGHAEELELEPAARVGGSVRSATSGAPLAGVEVAFERWHFGPAGMEERVSALSDPAGRWSLPWADPGMERFSVLRPGFTPERREFQVLPEGGDGYEILLADTHAFTLELFALESGATLADTTVLCDGVSVHTDAKGRLNVPALSAAHRDEGLRLTLALPEGCTTQLRMPAPAALVRVPLLVGGSVRGRVLDAAGAPVGGAQVRMWGSNRPPASIRLPEGVWINPGRNPSRSGADGTFTLAAQPPRDGPVALRAFHPEHPPGRSEPFAFAELGLALEHDVTLERGGTIRGTVRLDGEPESVRVFWEGTETNGWTRSNDRGDYRIPDAPAGEVSLRARLEDESDDLTRPEDTRVWVEEGGTVTADFELSSRGALLRGRVLDADGAPVAGAEIEAWPIDGDEEAWGFEEIPTTESDAEGRFELVVPDQPGLALDLFARSGARRAVARAVRPGGAAVELVLPAVATLALRVVDALRREPVQGFQLYWRASDEGEFERLAQGGRRFSPGPDGTFLAELPAGRLDLAIGARSQGFAPAQREGIELSPAREGGAAAELALELELGAELELVLELPPDGEARRHVQRGRVLLASAEQWAGRERGGEFYQQEVKNPQTLRPDANGVARMRAMPSGRYRFRGAPKGYAFRPAEFELPAVAHHRLTVVLEPEDRPGQAKPGGPGD